MFNRMSYTIQQLVPMTDRMSLLDAVVTFPQQGESIIMTTRVTITEQSLFYDSARKGVPAYVGIEYMAQTVACLAGWEDKTQRPDATPSIGFLVGTRKYEATTSLFSLGETLLISVRVEFRDMEMASMECLIERGDDAVHEDTSLRTERVNRPPAAREDARPPLAHAVLNVFRPQHLEQFVEEIT